MMQQKTQSADTSTFVIESIGFRDGGWLDTDRGRPHSDALRVTERLRRVDFGHIEAAMTINDPKAFVKPWTFRASFVYQDSHLLEATCEGQALHDQLRRMTPPPPEAPSPPLAQTAN